MTDLTPRQAVSAFLGHERIPADVLRAAVAQLVYGYDAIVDLATDATSIDGPASALSDLACELLAQQEVLEEYCTDMRISTSLPNLCRSRRTSAALFKRAART